MRFIYLIISVLLLAVGVPAAMQLSGEWSYYTPLSITLVSLVSLMFHVRKTSPAERESEWKRAVAIFFVLGALLSTMLSACGSHRPNEESQPAKPDDNQPTCYSPAQPTSGVIKPMKARPDLTSKFHDDGIISDEAYEKLAKVNKANSQV